MKIDEKAEREAFQLHWCPDGYDEVRDFHIHKQFALDAWLARAVQPVRVNREAFSRVTQQVDARTHYVADYAERVMHLLGIEVTP